MERGRRPQWTPARTVLGQPRGPSQFRPSPALHPCVLLGPRRQNSTASEPHLRVWSHSAVPNSISSHSQGRITGLGQARNLLPDPPRLLPVSIFYPKLPGSPSWWWLCPLCPVTFPCLTGDHTTQGKECLGRGAGGRQRDLPARPLSRWLVPALTQRPLPSLSRPRACLLRNHCKPQNLWKAASQLTELV